VIFLAQKLYKANKNESELSQRISYVLREIAPEKINELDGIEMAYEEFSRFVSKHNAYIDYYKTSLSSVYPLCEYAKIANIPTDVKDDWLKAAHESLDDVILVSANDDDLKATKDAIKQVVEFLKKFK
jgi:hypothetical protein